MARSDKARDMKASSSPVLLVLIVAALAAILLAAQAAEAKGGGGRSAGGGGGPKPSSGSSSKSSNPSGSVAKDTSANKGLPSGVANPASPYYNSPRYGVRHGGLSNFFLWSWLFHDRDDDEYEEEYVQSNYGFGGWVVLGIGIVGVVLLVRTLRKRAVAAGMRPRL